jgi:glutamate/aspartate transport system permease protein
MNYNWNWNIFWEAAPDGGGTYFDSLLSGVLWTLATAALAWIIALVLGAIIGTIRTAPNKWAANWRMATSNYSVTFRCWCKCFSGIS